MNWYEKELTYFLHQEYQIRQTAITLIHKTNHDQMRFLYNGKPRLITIHRQVNGVGQTKILDLKKQDIRRLLGNPPVKPDKEKRSLEEMTTELQTKAIADPNIFKEIKHEQKHHAYIACYKHNKTASRMILKFVVPDFLVKPSFLDISMSINYYDDETWEIKKGNSLKDVKFRPSDRKGYYHIFSHAIPRSLKTPFGISPAEIEIIDNSLIIYSRIGTRDAVRPHIMAKQNKVLLTSRIPNKATNLKSKNAPEILITPSNIVLNNLTEQMKKILSDINHLENTSGYKLIKVKETSIGPTHWEWRAPPIKLD